MSKIKITQERSKIRCIEKHKRTIEALGLRRINHSVVKEDTPQIRGMVAQVAYLVRVEPATGEAAAQSGASAKGPKATTKKAAGAKKAAASRAKRAAGAERAAS